MDSVQGEQTENLWHSHCEERLTERDAVELSRRNFTKLCKGQYFERKDRVESGSGIKERKKVEDIPSNSKIWLAERSFRKMLRLKADWK